MAKEVPDRGWSWVVAFACCFSSLVLAGIFRTSGVLFVAFISTFGVTREEASWPMVICISVLNLAGPFCGILGQRFGARPVVIAGSVIASIGISSCYFTTSLSLITVFFGGVFGIGYGFMNTVMPSILNAYFLNLRATANGIANAGSCIGSIILPVVFEHFISTYGLSGCFLLTGGIVLHMAIAGSLMRPPPWLQRKSFQGTKDGCRNTMIECGLLKKNTELPVPLDNGNSHDIVTTPLERLPILSQAVVVSDSHLKERRSISDYTLHIPSDGSALSTNTDTNSQSEQNLAKSTNESLKPPISLQLRTQPENERDQDVCPRCNGSPSTCACKKSYFSVVLSSFVTVLTCPMWYVTAITNVSFYFLYHMYVVIIVDYSLDRGVPDSSTKYILFVFSIADLFGRLCLGWITDRQLISRTRFVMMCMALIGVTFFMFPFATEYWSLIAVSSCYGLLLGCTMVVFPILLVDFLGIELHTVSYGCMCFMNGFSSFGRPFLIGYFRDNIGSYSNMFNVLGVLSAVASTLWLLEGPFERKRQGQPFFGNWKSVFFRNKQ